MRDKFAEVLNNLALEHEDIVVLAADISPVGRINEFVENYPHRFLNVGVAEQSMIGISAGLAMGGYRPFCYTIATFSILRPFEFVRNDLGYQDLPVVVVGMGAGLSYPTLGFTHHAQEDIAICSTIPNLEIWTPCDPKSVEHALKEIIKLRQHPVYLRLGKAGEPNLDFATDFDVFFLTYGTITSNVIEAANTLNDLGISSQVLSLLLIDPETFHEISNLIPRNALVVVVEEHIAPGGLASQFSLHLMKSGISYKFLHFSLPTLPSHLYGSQSWLLDQLGLSSSAISNRIRRTFD